MRRALPLVLLLAVACSTNGSQDEPEAVATVTRTATAETVVPVVTTTSAPSMPSPTPSPTPRATSPSPTRTTNASAYRWSSRRVSAAELGASWHSGCPVGPADLRLVTLTFVDWSGRTRTGELVVHRGVVRAVAAVFGELYDARFPIRSLRTVDEFGGSDDDSMAADNTSAFNCRDAVGGSGWSQHAFGRAVDVNPRENPYVYGGKVLPPEGSAYLDRSDHRKGMAYRGSAVNEAFARHGFSWGGGWRNPDYQHFSTSGT